MKPLFLVLLIAFVLMLVIGGASLIKGRRLKNHIKVRHPELFKRLYGDGIILGKSARNDMARVRFVHGGSSDFDNDLTLSKLRCSLRNVERFYVVVFAVVIVSFLALSLLR